MRRAWKVLGVLACILAALALSPRAGADEQRPRDVGRLPIHEPAATGCRAQIPDISLVINPRTRRAYQLCHPSGAQTWISAFDLRTPSRPKYIGTIRFDGGVLKADGPHVVDEAGGRIFLPILSGPTGSDLVFGGIAVLDERAFRDGNTEALRILGPPSDIYSLLVPVGIRYEPRTGKLLMLFDNVVQQPSDGALAGLAGLGGLQPAYLTPLVQWDADTGAEEWLVPSACPSAQTSAAPRTDPRPWDPPFLARDRRSVNIVCASRVDDATFVRIELGEDGQPTGESTTFRSYPSVRRILIDPPRDRTHVLVGADKGSFAITFDWTKGRILGTIVVSPEVRASAVAAGIDVDTGRIYVMSPRLAEIGGQTVRGEGAFLMADARRTPIPQALAFPDLADVTNDSVAPINVDPARDGRVRHVFFRPMKDSTSGQPYYRIIEDPVPVSQDPDTGGLDRTVDVDEAEGATVRAFSGGSSGYGSRVFSFGGGFLALSAESFTPTIGRCPGANREVVAASLNGASLSNVTAAARLSPVRTDHATEADLEDLSGCWPDRATSDVESEPREAPQALHGLGPGWGSRSGFLTGDIERPTDAECSGTHDGEGRDPRLAGAEAHASCKQDQETVNGSAAYPAIRFGPVTIGRSFVESVLRRDPKLGVVVEMRSVAEAIDIAGVGTIEAVRSFAMARANGRKPRSGDPMRTDWTVELCGVRTATFQQPGCASADAAFEALNAASDRSPTYEIRVLRPMPDPELLKGSPGGFIAGIQRDVGESIIVALENGDTHPAVPGLEIKIASRTSGRYVVQLAGVQAATIYGISLIPGSQAPDGRIVPNIPLPPVPVPPASPPVTPAPGGDVQQPGPVDDIVRVVKKNLGVVLRASLDALLAAGIWSIVATPMYLVLRRRRLRLAR